MITCGKYECSKVIGEGSYSQVRVATDLSTNKQWALKILKLNCEENEEALNEVRMLEGITHDNIVSVFDFAEEAEFKKDNKVKRVSYVAYELAEKGSLFDYVSQKGALSESTASHIFNQIVDAVEYLHLQGISHRDIKCENVVLDSKFSPKLWDFGFATKNIKCNDLKGSQGYMAPEIITKEGYVGQCADIFSLGVLLFAIVVGKLPFNNATQNDWLYKLISIGKMDLFWRTSIRNKEKVSTLSNEFKELVRSMLSSDPLERPSISEIKQNAWLNQQAVSYEQLQMEFNSSE